MDNTMVQKKCLDRVRLSHKVDCDRLAARQWFADQEKKVVTHVGCCNVGGPSWQRIAIRCASAMPRVRGQRCG